MKLSITKIELQRGLSRIQAIVEKRNTMPILANALLGAESTGDRGTLEIAATDLEVGIRSRHVAEITTPGSVTASAKKLFEIVRELPDESVQLEAPGSGQVQISCGRAEFKLAGSAAEEYPALPEIAPERVVAVQATVLGEMIERTIYAASTDETRYNLNGVHLEFLTESGKLRMVATDGHRLAYADRELGQEIPGLGEGVIIPRKGLAELRRLCEEEDADEVELGFEGNSVLARKEGVTLVMRLIEGEFPNYRQVIPREVSRQLVLPVDTIAQAVRRVILLSAERSRAVKLELSSGLLRLTCSNPDLGEAREELDTDYAGDEFTIAFNARYLTDALAVMHAKEVRFSFHDPLSPIQLSPADDESALAVVMPMRT
jgi:DNA polymerase-3 subunit beta